LVEVVLYESWLITFWADHAKGQKRVGAEKGQAADVDVTAAANWISTSAA